MQNTSGERSTTQRTAPIAAMMNSVAPVQPDDHVQWPSWTVTQAFQIEEYKALRKEVELALEGIHKLEQYAFAGAGITWGWLVAHHTANLFLWCLPILIMVVLYARVQNMVTQLYAIAGHIRSIEKSFGWHGWEHRSDPVHGHKVTLFAKAKGHFGDNVLELGGFVAALLAAFFRNHLLQ